MLSKLLFFSLIGLAGTFVHYLTLYSLVEAYQMNPVSASCLGALLGLVVNYSLNFKFNFKSTQPHQQTLPKFACIALLGMAWNWLLMNYLTQQIFYLYAQLISTFLVLNWNFLLNYFWTFNLEKIAISPQSSFKQQHHIFKDWGLGLIIAIFFIRLAVSGFYPLYDPSESRYAEMARKMLETAQWIMPMIDYGIPFWGKPPLTIWLSAISLNFAGINEFAVRLPSTLLGIGIVWLIYQLAKAQSNRAAGTYAALVLSSMVLFFVMCGTVAMDQCMTFGITLAMTAFWRSLKGTEKWWGYGFFLGLSIGLLAKGPITVVLTGLAIGSWTIATRNYSLVWQRIPWIKGSLLSLALCLPWYWGAEQFSPGFLNYFFIGEHWKRFTEPGWTGDLYGVGRQHSKGMIWIYWLAAAFPWSLIFIYRLVLNIKQKTATNLLVSTDNWRLYCLFWMLSPLLFFTLSANLIWTYVLPGLPGLALLLSDWPETTRINQKVLALLVPLAFSAIVLVYQVTDLDFYKSQKRLVTLYQQQANSEQQLIYLKGRPDSAQFYLKGQSVQLNNIEALENSINSSEQNFYVLQTTVIPQLPENISQKLKLIESYGKFSLFKLAGNN